MDERTYVYQSDFAKKHQAKGRAEGLTEGQAKGLAEGRANAILDVLDARGLHVSDEARDRIRSCVDLAQLASWVRKAVTVASVEEMF